MLRRAIAVLVALLAVGGAACGGVGDADDLPAPERLTLWIGENQPDRVRGHARQPQGVHAPRPGSGWSSSCSATTTSSRGPRRRRRTGTLPDVMQVGMADVHAFVQKGYLDPDAAQQTVDELGEQTFSARALSLADERRERRWRSRATAGGSC